MGTARANARLIGACKERNCPLFRLELLEYGANLGQLRFCHLLETDSWPKILLLLPSKTFKAVTTQLAHFRRTGIDCYFHCLKIGKRTHSPEMVWKNFPERIS